MIWAPGVDCGRFPQIVPVDPTNFVVDDFLSLLNGGYILKFILLKGLALRLPALIGGMGLDLGQQDGK